MDNFDQDDTYSQDNLYVEIKTEMDEFIHVLGTLPALEEFKQQVEIMFQALDSQYSGVNFIQRQLLDIKTKLKTNVKNKTEVTKNIEDDLERYESLKKEVENYNLKIDQVKFDEEEKEKRLADQKIEIAKLYQKKDEESLANFSPQDIAKKQDLINQSEALEMDYKDHFDRKQQYFEKTKEITNEKNQLEILGEQKRKNVIDLEKKKLDLEKQIVDAKTSKDKNDAEFKRLKEESANKEQKIDELTKQSEQLQKESKNLTSTKEEKESNQKDIKSEILMLQSRRIPQLNKKKK